MKRVTIMLLSSILLFSCSNSKNENKCPINITIQESEVKEAAYTNFDFISLETSDQCLLGNDISKVEMGSDFIYLLPANEGIVYIFNKEGKFVSKLNRGKSFGEVNFISDFCINNNHLFVLDNYKLVKEYDEKGNFIRKVKQLESPAYGISFVSGNLMTFETNLDKKNDYYIQIFKDGINHCILPKDVRFKALTFAVNRFHVQNKYIAWQFSDVIYKVDDDSIEPHIHINFQDKNIWDKKSEELSKGVVDKAYHEKSFIKGIRDFMAIDDNTFFFGYEKDKPYFVRYSKGNYSLYDNVLADFPVITTGAVGEVGNSLIYTVKANEILDYYNRVNATTPSAQKLKIANIQANDNPLLVIVPIG